MREEKEAAGLVCQIQRFCVDDGPGIRTTVFLQGCAMRCEWCHNPETQPLKPCVQLFADRCTGCGRCVPVCPAGARRLEGGRLVLDRSRCTACGRCAEACLPGATEISSRPMTVGEVMRRVAADEPFYRTSGGGVTFSGGEPLRQPAFLARLLAACAARGYHTALETALDAPWQEVAAQAPLVGLFLADLKGADPARHRRFTGVDNARILDNIARLARGGHAIIVRIPLVPGRNDSPGELAGMADFLARAGVCRVQLMPYHAMAEAKYRSLGRTYNAADVEPPTDAQKRQAADVFRRRGIDTQF